MKTRCTTSSTVCCGRMLSRTATVFNARPTMRCAPGTEGSRPVTALPKITSSRPVSCCSITPHATWTRLARLTPSSWARAARAASSCASNGWDTVRGTGSLRAAEPATRVGSSSPARYSRQASESAAASLEERWRRCSRKSAGAGSAAASWPGVATSVNSSSKSTDWDHASVSRWCWVTISSLVPSGNRAANAPISGGRCGSRCRWKALDAARSTSSRV